METEMKNNQENQEKKHGGARKGAGRPVGSGHKPKLVDELTDKQKEALVRKTYEKAMEGDSKLLQFLVEQIFGKAQQSVDMMSDGEKMNIVSFNYVPTESDNQTDEETTPRLDETPRQED